MFSNDSSIENDSAKNPSLQEFFKALLLSLLLAIPALVLLLLAFLSQEAKASIPKTEILAEIDQRFLSFSNQDKWKSFLAKNQNLFPPVSKDKPDTVVVVEKEELQLLGDSFTLGMGYRETFIHAPVEKVKTILNTPELFRYLYGLDGDSKVEVNKSAVTKPAGLSSAGFQAHILKKIPILPNQDYILEYTDKTDGGTWFQQARLVKDLNDFALRNNLKVLEPVEGGTVFREISMVYVLSWYLRALGPQVRSVMKDELRKITDSVKCAAETTGEFTESVAKSCWITAAAATKSTVNPNDVLRDRSGPRSK